MSSGNLIIANMAGQDTGGQAAKLTLSFNEFSPSDDMRSFSLSNPLGYPDTTYALNSREHPNISSFLSSCDIIHVHNKFWYADLWFNKYKVKPKPSAVWIFHQHGRNHSRELPVQISTRRAHRIVSTHNLLGYVGRDFSRWLPAPFDSRMFETITKNNKRFSADDGILRVCQSPTNRAIKETEKFINIAYSSSQIAPLKTVIIENMRNPDCLSLKSRCDICFEQMTLGLGNSGIESMFFRQPVLVGHDHSLTDIIDDYIGYVPYIKVDWNTLGSKLISLVKDKSERTTFSTRGYRYVMKYHDYPSNVDIVKNIYKKAMSNR